MTTNLEHGTAVGPQLQRILRDRIVRGDILPGARISESEIAVVYAVSRQPVREAFIKLSEEGLLEVRPQRGTYVTLISVPAVLSSRFIREAVEADIVRSVAKTATPQMLARLDACIAEQHRLRQEASGDDFMRADEDFHRCLAEMVGQAAVAKRLEDLKIHMNRVRYISAREVRHTHPIEQHSNIVEAVRAHDPDQAEAAMRLHLREILNDLPGIVAAQTDCFTGTKTAELVS